MKKKISLLCTMLCLTLGVSAQEIDKTQLLIVGDPVGGWNCDATPMEMVGEGIFTWTGRLGTGNFRFFNSQNCFDGTNIRSGNGQYLTDVVMGVEYPLTTASAPDNNFTITSAGLYTIDVDLNTMMMVVNPYEVPVPDALWIVGDAVPNGSTPLFRDHSGLPVMRFIGELQAGQFKFRTTETVTEETKYIVPVLTTSPDINGQTDIRTINDANAPGWTVDIPGIAYKINLDIYDNVADAQIFNAPNNIYLVGDGCAAGWSPENSIPLEKDPNNPYLFTLEVELSVTRPESGTKNAVKILLQQDNWYPAVSPYTADEAITESQYIMFAPSDSRDTRWTFSETEQGRYSITVDLLNETFRARYDDGTALVSVNQEKLFSVKADGRSIKIVTEKEKAISATLFDIYGKQIDACNARTSVTLGKNLPAGIYIVKVNSGKEHYAVKMRVK